MNSDLAELILPLEERNLAEVLSAVALASLTSRAGGNLPFESTCWWDERGFVLRTALSQSVLFDSAYEFLSTISWVVGLGAAEQGTFVAGGEIGTNPFISLPDAGQKKPKRPPFRTFSARVVPAKLLPDQQKALRRPSVGQSWLLQSDCGIASWGYDCRVGSHAYDQGFSSNEDRSGGLDPIFPAVELLGIACASFFSAVQGWQMNDSEVGYAIWTQPISLSLVSFAVADRLDGLPTRRYSVTNRGAAYGKGAAYRYFPEATLRA